MKKIFPITTVFCSALLLLVCRNDCDENISKSQADNIVTKTYQLQQ